MLPAIWAGWTYQIPTMVRFFGEAAARELAEENSLLV